MATDREESETAGRDSGLLSRQKRRRSRRVLSDEEKEAQNAKRRGDAYNATRRGKRKEEARRYRERHRDKANAKQRERYLRDKAAYVARASKWNKANWAKVLAWRRIRSKREDVKAQTRKKAASRYAADPGYAIKRRLTGRVRAALKARQGSKKADAFINLIGCSPDMLLAHLKRQFRPGMTLENRGEWHIDHIRPCASFDLRDPEQQRACFHYTNLQPLWAIDNLQKSAKWNGRQYKRNRAA